LSASPPEWLRPLLAAVADPPRTGFDRYAPPAVDAGRRSAVLILFGESSAGPDLLFIERSATLRSHAGQPAFPGGVVEETDPDPAAAALREAQEETGLDPAGVEVLATLTPLWLPPSGFVVRPVLAWWRRPTAVRAVDPAEVARVARVAVRDLADPARRTQVVHPSGYMGPGFEVDGFLVWGFTARLVDTLLELGGWARPWDRSRVRQLPAETARLAARDRGPREGWPEPR